MAILVNELGSILRPASTYPWLWASSFILLVSAVVYKTFIPNVRPQIDPRQPFFKASRNSLVTRLLDVVTKLPVFPNELAIQGVQTKAVGMEWDAAMPHSNEMATESQALLARILDLESENKTLTSKLQMNEMTIACLERQVALKTESQNEILDDMNQLEEEFEAAKGELDAAKTTIIDLEAKLRDSGMQVVSLDRQLAMKTEAQREILDDMDQLEEELKTAKAKIQEAAAQKAATERDLVELRELANREETRILYTEPRAPIASESDSNAQPALNSCQWQLNTPPASPQKSLFFRSVKDSFARKADVSPTSSKFSLPSMRIPSRRGKAGDSPKKSFSGRHGVSSTVPTQIDEP